MIRVKRNKDFSKWEVSADNYMIVYHHSGLGYKGRTPQTKVDNLIKEIREELGEDTEVVFEEYGETLEEEEVSEIQNQQSEEDEIKKAEEKAEEEFEKALKKISDDKTTDVIEELYEIPKRYATMVALGHRKGLILYGRAGLGKSHNVMKAFQEAGVDFKYMSGHITNLELYQFLYKHRTEHIILDDVNILDNEINLNMLKSALNDKFPNVCYNTSSGRLKVPNIFRFEGSITILLNKKPKNNESLKAVESRILTHELKLDYRDKIKILKQISLMDYEGLTIEDRDVIFEWIRQNTSESTEDFNLRILFHLFEMYKFDKVNWKRLAKNILKTNYEMDLIIQGLDYKEWVKQTGKSMKTYYRYKEKMKIK